MRQLQKSYWQCNGRSLVLGVPRYPGRLALAIEDRQVVNFLADFNKNSIQQYLDFRQYRLRDGLIILERLASPQVPGRDALDTLVRPEPEMARYIVSRTFAIVSIRPIRCYDLSNLSNLS